MACKHTYIYRDHMCLASKQLYLREMLDAIYEEGSDILQEEDASKDDAPFGPLLLILAALENLEDDEIDHRFEGYKDMILHRVKGLEQYKTVPSEIEADAESLNTKPS